LPALHDAPRPVAEETRLGFNERIVDAVDGTAA
jgi:hypothetical protein